MSNRFHRMPDICVIGAGVSGLLSAIELADAGYSVQIIDRKRAAMESTWASGGIMSPLYPWRYSPPITALAAYSRSIFPQLIDRLRDTGIDPEYRQNGMLVLDSFERVEALNWANEMHEDLVEMSIEDARRLEPNVKIEEPPIWMSSIGSVRTPRLGQAMRQTCLSHPRINLTEYKQVSLRGSSDSPELAVDEVITSFERILITAGAWTTLLLRPLKISCPIKPIKGQMLLFASNELINRVVLSNERYAIPRADGRLAFGSTIEDVGFYRTPDQAAFKALYHAALGLIPDLINIPLELQWSGLRPASPDGIPWIGALSPRLWVNAGQYRNGIALSSASAKLVADLMAERVPCVNPVPFEPKDYT